MRKVWAKLMRADSFIDPFVVGSRDGSVSHSYVNQNCGVYDFS